MILTIAGAVYFSACAAFLIIYRRALRHASLRTVSLLPHRRNNVIPFPRKPVDGKPPSANIESINSIR